MWMRLPSQLNNEIVVAGDRSCLSDPMSQATTHRTDIHLMDVTQQAEVPAGPSHADAPAPEPFLIIRPTRGWGASDFA
jgi:hypothetical protein